MRISTQLYAEQMEEEQQEVSSPRPLMNDGPQARVVGKKSKHMTTALDYGLPIYYHSEAEAGQADAKDLVRMRDDADGHNELDALYIAALVTLCAKKWHKATSLADVRRSPHMLALAHQVSPVPFARSQPLAPCVSQRSCMQSRWRRSSRK